MDIPEQPIGVVSTQVDRVNILAAFSSKPFFSKERVKVYEKADEEREGNYVPLSCGIPPPPHRTFHAGTHSTQGTIPCKLVFDCIAVFVASSEHKTLGSP